VVFSCHSFQLHLSLLGTCHMVLRDLCDSSVGIATGYELDGRGSFPGKGKRFFIFSAASRQALGPTQPPAQWVPGKTSGSRSRSFTSIWCRGQKWWSYTSAPRYVFLVWCLIHELSTRTTLPLPFTCCFRSLGSKDKP
jgi:hypothetical protein